MIDKIRGVAELFGNLREIIPFMETDILNCLPRTPDVFFNSLQEAIFSRKYLAYFVFKEGTTSTGGLIFRL